MESIYLVLGHSSGELRVFFENASSSDLKFKKPEIVGFTYIIPCTEFDIYQLMHFSIQ
jgi:hypothetical protein